MHLCDDSECRKVYFEWDRDVTQIHIGFQVNKGLSSADNCLSLCEEKSDCWGMEEHFKGKGVCWIYGPNWIEKKRPAVHGAHSCFRTPVEKRKSVF